MLRTAVPGGDWRSIRVTCDESGGWTGAREFLLDETTSFLQRVGDTVLALYEPLVLGQTGIGYYHAEKIVVPKKVGSAGVFPIAGLRVYWDPADRRVSSEYESTYLWIGISTKPAAADDTTVEIDLKGERAEAELGLA